MKGTIGWSGTLIEPVRIDGDLVPVRRDFDVLVLHAVSNAPQRT